MSTSTIPHSDHTIQDAVLTELGWAPGVDAAGIGVAVEDATVALSGEVDSYAERVAATQAARRVRGVTAVVDNLVVHPARPGYGITDTDIAKSIQRAFQASTIVPETISADVHHGVVVLRGTVQWNYERTAARKAVESLRGVTRVDDMTSLTARASATDTAERIQAALVRDASIEASRIHVTCAGTTVTLTGTVKSWSERTAAARAAWSSPHVETVKNLLTIPAY